MSGPLSRTGAKALNAFEDLYHVRSTLLQQRQQQAPGTPPVALGLPPPKPAPVRLGLICREGVNGEGASQGKRATRVPDWGLLIAR